MVVNNEEWGIDDCLDESWFYDVDFERKEEEKHITNDDFLIYHTNDIEVRNYIIKELNNINSILSAIQDVAE